MSIPAQRERPPATNGEPTHRISDLDATRFTSDSTGSGDDKWGPDPYSDVPHTAEMAIEEAPTFAFSGGDVFILDEPEKVPAIWGEGNEVLWAAGEAFMIAGPQGTGKTTLTGQIAKARMGIGPSEVLGFPVVRGERILYLAMDRPSQISRALGRIFSEEDRSALAEKLLVHRGPPPSDLARHPEMLAAMCIEAGADTVIIDSLKDAAVGLVDDTVGASYNRARQYALRAGVQVLDLHHVKKKSADRRADGLSIDDIYGSTWLTSGCGSVIFLSGEPGDPIVGMKHIKQPADEVGPFRLNHDQRAGLMTVEHAYDIYEMVRASGADGLTAKDAAKGMFETDAPSRAETQKARRKLDEMAQGGQLVEHKGERGRGNSSSWFLPVRAA